MISTAARALIWSMVDDTATVVRRASRRLTVDKAMLTDGPWWQKNGEPLGFPVLYRAQVVLEKNACSPFSQSQESALLSF